MLKCNVNRTTDLLLLVQLNFLPSFLPNTHTHTHTHTLTHTHTHKFDGQSVEMKKKIEWNYS